MSYLEIAKTLATKYEKNEINPQTSNESPVCQYELNEVIAPCPIDELRAFIAELPPVDTWNLDETVARIRQLSHDERAVFFAALTHDWTAWKLAMAAPNVDGVDPPTMWRDRFDAVEED